MKRREFFNKLARVAAGAAVAPMAAPVILKALEPKPSLVINSFWLQSSRLSHCYSKEYIEVLTDAVTAGQFRQAMQDYYHKHHSNEHVQVTAHALPNSAARDL